MSSLVKVSEAASIALHTMALLAAGEGRRLPTRSLARQLGVSEFHLAKVLQRLSRMGLVESVRGPGGGFILGKPADRISLLDIYEAIEGPLESLDCLLSKPVCDGRCMLGGLLDEIGRKAGEYLASSTLEDLKERFHPRASLN